jgi:DNA-binding transcriptional MocR family regulator
MDGFMARTGFRRVLVYEYRISGVRCSSSEKNRIRSNHLASALKRYEALAADMAASIRSGALKPGDRLPSVREASKTRKVSPATVFEAYYRLEAEGLVEARPRSGYYVRARTRRLSPEPEQRSSPAKDARSVAISDLVFDILRSTASRDVVPLGSAFPSPLLFPLARIGRVLARVAPRLDPWSTVDELTLGSVHLRRQIARRYHLSGAQVSPESIVVTQGALEALNLCLAATCRPGDAVLVESPCFYGCLQALERLGLRALQVPTDPKEGIDLGALEEALVQGRARACWVMTNFQNPLGSLMSEAKKRALVDLCSRYEVPLIEDDVYAELYSGARPPALTKAFDGQGWVLHCSSFSKSLAPGYRIGWVAPGRFLDAMVKQKLAASLATSLPGQLAIAGYLAGNGFARHLRGLRAQLQQQREAYRDAIARAFPKGTRISRPAGGYFLWVELPGGFDAMALLPLARDAGISVAPGPMFSADGGFGHCLRVNTGHVLDHRAVAAIRQLGRFATLAG